jgi:hypothetical protein
MEQVLQYLQGQGGAQGLGNLSQQLQGLQAFQGQEGQQLLQSAQQYLQSHPELNQYIQAIPQAGQQGGQQLNGILGQLLSGQKVPLTKADSAALQGLHQYLQSNQAQQLLVQYQQSDKLQAAQAQALQKIQHHLHSSSSQSPHKLHKYLSGSQGQEALQNFQQYLHDLQADGDQTAHQVLTDLQQHIAEYDIGYVHHDASEDSGEGVDRPHPHLNPHLQLQGLEVERALDEMHQLWRDHAAWEYQFTTDEIRHLDSVAATQGRLLKNQDQLGDNFARLYGKSLGNRYAQLLREHILLEKTIVDKTVAGQSTAAEYELSLINGGKIVDLWASVNPHLDREVLMRHWRNHLDSSAGAASAYAGKRYKEAIRYADLNSENIQKFFGYLATGIHEQGRNGHDEYDNDGHFDGCGHNEHRRHHRRRHHGRHGRRHHDHKKHH